MAEVLSGTLTTRPSAQVSSTTAGRCSICSCASISEMVRTGPNSAPARANSTSHSALVFWSMTSVTTARSSGRLVRRRWLMSKRGSVASSGRPRAAQNRGHVSSVHAPAMTGPSAVGKTS